MRPHIYILSVMFLIVTNVAIGQHKDSLVAEINQWVQSIEKDTTYRKLTLGPLGKAEQMANDFSQLTAYVSNGKVCKLTETINFANCTTTFQYYFRNGQLVMVYETEKQLKDTLAKTGSLSAGHGFEGYYYYSGGKPVSTKFTGKKVIGRKYEFIERSGRLMELISEKNELKGSK